MSYLPYNEYSVAVVKVLTAFWTIYKLIFNGILTQDLLFELLKNPMYFY